MQAWTTSLLLRPAASMALSRRATAARCRHTGPGSAGSASSAAGQSGRARSKAAAASPGTAALGVRAVKRRCASCKRSTLAASMALWQAVSSSTSLRPSRASKRISCSALSHSSALEAGGGVGAAMNARLAGGTTAAACTCCFSQAWAIAVS